MSRVILLAVFLLGVCLVAAKPAEKVKASSGEEPEKELTHEEELREQNENFQALVKIMKQQALIDRIKQERLNIEYRDPEYTDEELESKGSLFGLH